jgi:hypothetical protein
MTCQHKPKEEPLRNCYVNDVAWKATTVNVLCVETSADENFELSPGGES